MGLGSLATEMPGVSTRDKPSRVVTKRGKGKCVTRYCMRSGKIAGEVKGSPNMKMRSRSFSAATARESSKVGWIG